MRVNRRMALLLAWVPVLCTAAPFEPFAARFELEARGIAIASVQWTLQRSGNGFSFTSISESTAIAALLGGGQVKEQSHWTDTGDGARPARYSYGRTGGRARSESIVYDWAAGVSQVRLDADTSRVPIPAGTVDSLSYVLVLRQDLARGKQVLDYPVITGKGLRHHRFRRAGPQRIDSALGPLETVRLVRERDDTDPRQTTLWLAPAYGYFPVRIEHHERDGEILVLRIQSLDVPRR